MIFPVILCGGSGTRLWPLSRTLYPKQFVNFEGDKNLFSKTFERASGISETEEPLVVCNENHRFFVLNSLKELKKNATLLIEPETKNTAPAIALCALYAKTQDPESILVVLPADHSIKNQNNFFQSVHEAIKLAAKDYLVTFGIYPTFPATGFGYIEPGEPIENNCFQICKFIEKPDIDKAKKMLSSGNFLWNSGMFVFKANVFLEELKSFEPLIYAATLASFEECYNKKEFLYFGAEEFRKSPSLSVDYAVMERTNRAAVIPMDSGWNDLGTWASFYEMGEKDSRKNVAKGDVIAEKVEGCYLHSTGRLVTAIGIKDLAVVETKDAVLVMPVKSSQEVKGIVQKLREKRRPEIDTLPIVYRPWGSYETLAHGERFQVKRIIVRPSERLSLQMHHHRAEHWIVVQGTAEIQIGEEVRLLTENQSTFIPIGMKHRLSNPGKVPLVLIEVQSGAYLGEDDIIRFEDIYERA